ncbi:MAG: uncharacterized SAM-binding protein YcdF (DUF218 family) [Gammaproteobacteria bacterium]|jgi:uncharacterized SAM-binding protein YcdF (DUF218 family)
MRDSVPLLFLTKLMPVFVFPLGLAILLALVAGFCLLMRWRRAATSFGIISVTVLWICSAPSFADWAMGTLERQYPPRAIADTPSADVAIVLGGAVNQPMAPRVAIELIQSSDRVLHAARLYRAGKVARILVSGGNIPWLPSIETEAQLIRRLLIEWGVPDEAIATAGASRNTYENALEIVQMRKNSSFDSALLVTSAAHMPRAMAVFRRAGIPVTASTTDVEVVDGAPFTILRWLPDAGALAMTTAAMKEWIGFWAYRARGYL